jgi:hypothetical protein
MLYILQSANGHPVGLASLGTRSIALEHHRRRRRLTLPERCIGLHAPLLSRPLPNETQCRLAGRLRGRPEGSNPLSGSAEAISRTALAAAQIGLTGMRSVRAIGPQGQRFTAGLYGEHVFLLELPWRNPRNECRSLRSEPPGVEWQAYSAGTREV